MKRLAILVCAQLSFTLSHGAAFATEQPSNENAGRIRSALERYLCSGVYWSDGEPHQRGTPRPVTVLVDRDWFYARMDNVTAKPKGERWTVLYEGTVNQGGARVVKAFSSPESSFWDAGYVGTFKPWLRQWFTERPTTSFQVTIPVDCPRYDPPTPEKNRMVGNVVASVRELLRWPVEHPAQAVPADAGEVHLVIADFNVDDPDTYVFVEETHEVFRVALHDPDGIDEDTYQREGKYIVGEAVTGTNLSEEDIAEEKARLTRKIRAHGIPRTIVLRDAPGKQGANASVSERSADAKSDSDRR